MTSSVMVHFTGGNKVVRVSTNLLTAEGVVVGESWILGPPGFLGVYHTPEIYVHDGQSITIEEVGEFIR